jgi:hypothetical protein
MTRIALVPVLGLIVAVALAADESKPMPKAFKSHDMSRPRPVVIDAGSPTVPPSDAISLFDGKSLSEWKRAGKLKPGEEDIPKWKIEAGVFEIVRGTGSIMTRKTFGDAQIHLEWATPAVAVGKGQGRGNSGLHMGGFGEVQILDSFESDTYPDGQAAALYGRFPPLVNASRKPGEWQTYDIITRLPKLDDSGKVIKPGLITVLHNGIVVHHAVEFHGKIGPYALSLQDHGNPIRFRNFWLRLLRGYDEPAPMPKPTTP